jgi:hypothetical protein
LGDGRFASGKRQGDGKDQGFQGVSSRLSA